MNYQSSFWNRYFRFYDVLLKVIPYQELFESIVKSLKLHNNLKVLDLGAGTGNLNKFISECVDVTSLDNSDEALARLKSKFPESKVVKQSLLERLPFGDNSFDRVVSNNVLYTLHKTQWIAVVSEIKRVTKPQGLIVVSNLNKDFKAINIYKDHIKKSLIERGVFMTLLQLLSLVYPTIQMIRYNKMINRSDEVGQYSFLEANEQKAIFESLGISSAGETKQVYSNQALMNVFVNSKG